MKKVFLTLSIFWLVSCGSPDENVSKNLTVTNFLKDTRSLSRVNVQNPIEEFEQNAKSVAAKTMNISKETLDEFLELGKEYKSGVIVVEDHTIVRIDDFETCTNSASWKACIPFGEGYIKKGELVFQKDYINNIIGRPDSQKRVGYLFN